MVDALVEKDPRNVCHECSVARIRLWRDVDVDIVRRVDCEAMSLSTVIDIVEVDYYRIAFVDEYPVRIEDIMGKSIQGVVEGESVREDIDLPRLGRLILRSSTRSKPDRGPRDNGCNEND